MSNHPSNPSDTHPVRSSGTWSDFIAQDRAKAATLVAIVALLLAGTQPADTTVRLAQFLCSSAALLCVAVLAYRDEPRAPVTAEIRR